MPEDEKNNNYKILIVDDSMTVLYYMEDFLKSKGFDVITAKNGLEAAEKAYSEKPDLIISDIEMPKMTGYQLCRLLKNEDKIKEIPVILLTSKNDASSKFWGLETGADKYIKKDFGKNDYLLSSINSLLVPEKVNRIRQILKGVRSIAVSDLLTKLNMMLDKELYETTIINKISEIGYSVTDIEKTIENLFELLKKIIDFQMGSIILDSESNINYYVYLNRTTDSAFMQDYNYYLLAEAAEMMNLTLENLSDIKTHIFYQENEVEMSEQKFENDYAFFRPIVVHKDKIGIFSMVNFYTKGFTDEDINLLNKLKSHIDVIIDNARMYDKIKTLSIYDGLTKLYNRRHLMELLDKEFLRTTRYNNSNLSVMILDIDNFKHVNDTYGHLSGDIVLKNISAILRENVRSVDILGRYGGEEFVGCFPETTKANAVSLVERIRSNIEKFEQVLETGDIIHITASIGLASLSDGEFENISALLKLADDRLYIAKESGKNKVVFE